MSKRLIKPKTRTIIFDFAEEHQGTYVRSAEAFLEFDKKHPTKDVNVRFPIDAEDDEIIGITEDILHYLYKTRLNGKQETLLVFEEAQFFFPQQIPSATIKRILTVGRHARLNIIANSQRPSLVSKTLLSQADEVYLGNIWETYDLQYLKRYVNANPEEISLLQPFEFIKFSSSEKIPEKITL